MWLKGTVNTKNLFPFNFKVWKLKHIWFQGRKKDTLSCYIYSSSSLPAPIIGSEVHWGNICSWVSRQVYKKERNNFSALSLILCLSWKGQNTFDLKKVHCMSCLYGGLSYVFNLPSLENLLKWPPQRVYINKDEERSQEIKQTFLEEEKNCLSGNWLSRVN